MTCACTKSRISYTDKAGLGRVATVHYRCAKHRAASRADDVKRHAAGLAWLASVRAVQRLALPAPLVQLS